jgi:cytochrome bd-type quinol oxidase subunit 2
MTNAPQRLAYCCLAVLIALYVVGAVSNGSLRHEVQTLPLWVPIVLGFRQRGVTKWAALPCLIFWLAIMVFIWLFLLGWARVVTGHFSPTEIVMTLVVGVACLVGIGLGLRWRTTVRPLAAAGFAVLLGLLQVLAFRISLYPYIATH